MIPNGATDRWQDPALLDHLRRVRGSWDALTRRIVHATLFRFVPQVSGQFLELGAGDGQLRDWLPPEVARRTIHTEPSESFLTRLRARHPAALSVAARADDLPFPDGSIACVLGLCLLDTVTERDTVRDELARVLCPGGRLVHFLDLATSTDVVFPELIARGDLPLTNFLSDPSLTAGLPESQRARLPHTDPFDDILAIPFDAFVRFVVLLKAAGHPVVTELGPFADAAEHAPDPDRLAGGFMATSADPERLRAVNRGLLRLTLLAISFGREWALRPVSSRDCFRRKLLTLFSPETGFEVLFAGPVSAWERHTTTAADQPAFTLRHAGRTIRRDQVAPIPGTSVAEWDRDSSAAPPAGDEPIRATTVETFVARKRLPETA